MEGTGGTFQGRKGRKARKGKVWESRRISKPGKSVEARREREKMKGRRRYGNQGVGRGTKAREGRGEGGGGTTVMPKTPPNSRPSVDFCRTSSSKGGVKFPYKAHTSQYRGLSGDVGDSSAAYGDTGEARKETEMVKRKMMVVEMEVVEDEGREREG